MKTVETKKAPSPLARKHRRKKRLSQNQIITLGNILQEWGYDRWDIENVTLALAAVTGQIER